MQIFQALNFVGFLWLASFISAITEIILAGTFSTWYWTFKKSRVPFFVLTQAVGRTLRYHTGTAALGALIITLCRYVRSLLGVGSSGNGCGPCMCLRCLCLCCLEKFLRRFNRNAYIMCAVHGKGLCVSAVGAYQLILRNCLRYIAADTVSWMVFFFSKMLLACATGTAAYFYYKSWSVLHIFLPVLALTFGAFYIFGVFFSVYSVAVDTLVLCARKYLVTIHTEISI